jgi:hypothetical protein
MLHYVDLVDVDDVVVVDRHVDLKSSGTNYFVGGYTNNLFGGVMPTSSKGSSNTVGDVVFMCQGRPTIVISQISDPDGVVTMVKSIMNEMYPRK